jgi:hypothetical protein
MQFDLKTRRKLSALIQVMSLTALFLLTGGLPALAEEPTRERVQSVFIYKFLKFTKWPYQSPTAQAPEFRIGIVGETSMTPILKEFEGRSVHNRKIVIETEADLKALDQYRVLIFSKNARNKWKRWKDKLENRPILTIADWDGFAESGGHVNFFLFSGKVRFKINYTSTTTAGLSISSRVLQLADIVTTTVP